MTEDQRVKHWSLMTTSLLMCVFVYFTKHKPKALTLDASTNEQKAKEETCSSVLSAYTIHSFPLLPQSMKAPQTNTQDFSWGHS